MDRTKEGILSTSDTNTAGKDIEREHCYFETNTKMVLFCHLRDHNYFVTKRQKPNTKKTKTTNRKVKITELKAIYNCKCCGYRTMRRDLSLKHYCDKKYIPCTQCKRNKIPEGYQQCTKCTYFTKNKASLKVHMRIHAEGTPYKCTECSYSAKDLTGLIFHYDVVKDLKCDCGFSTHVRQRMAAHQQFHAGCKPFSCGICNFCTGDRSVLFRHMKKHEV